MKNSTRAEMIRNRISLLEARTKKDNGNIIKALRRNLRNLEK